MGLPTSLTAEDEALPVAYRVLWPLLTSALISQSRFQFLNRAQCLPAEALLGEADYSPEGHSPFQPSQGRLQLSFPLAARGFAGDP